MKHYLVFIAILLIFVGLMAAITYHPPIKKAAISSDSLTVSASTEAIQQQADSSIKP